MASITHCVALSSLLALVAGLEVRRAHDLELVASEHHWPTARGPHLRQFGFTAGAIPKDFSASLAWSWQHPDGKYHTVVTGGPVINAARSVYLTTNDGVRKFSPDGQVLWYFQQFNKKMNNQVALYGDKVFGSNEDGGAFALDAQTGEPVWLKKLAGNAGAESSSPAAYDGVFVMGADLASRPPVPGGNRRVFGLDASNGVTLWDFEPETPVRNLSPLFPGDGTVVFMDSSGSVYRLGLRNGTQLWRARAEGSELSVSTGGPTLGPDGAVYACSNQGASLGKEGSKGLLRALRVADGRLLWQQTLPQPCLSYPAVGPLGEGSALSVVVTPGSSMGQPGLHGSIMAFDAATGALQWRFNAAAYSGVMNLARGDFAGLGNRSLFNAGHKTCSPPHWSSAHIVGDGTVLAGRADGVLYAVKGPSSLPVSSQGAVSLADFGADFLSTPGIDVRTWDAQAAAQQGAFGFAPGLTAFATCDTLYVFKG